MRLAAIAGLAIAALPFAAWLWLQANQSPERRAYMSACMEHAYRYECADAWRRTLEGD